MEISFDGSNVEHISIDPPEYSEVKSRNSKLRTLANRLCLKKSSRASSRETGTQGIGVLQVNPNGLVLLLKSLGQKQVGIGNQ